MTTSTKNPLLWVPSGYFTIALTYNILTVASVIMFSNLGLDNAQAAAYASMLGTAYVIKPAFAVFFEMYKTKKFFLILTQVLLGIGFIAAALILNLPNYLMPLLALFWVLSFLGSSQDIVNDGVYITSLDSKTQATFCGVQGLSWNLGKTFIVGALVALTGYLHENILKHDPHVSGSDWLVSWQSALVLIGVIMLIMAFWHSKTMPEGSKLENAPKSVKEAVATLADAFITFFQKKGIWLMIGFALLFRLSYGFITAPSVLFLKDSIQNGGLSLTNQEVGFLYGVIGLGASVIGSILGGIYVARKGLKKALFPFCVFINVPNVTFLLMAIYQPQSHFLVGLGVVIEQFFFGIGSVGFIIYLMQQLAPGKYSTAHYAFGNSLMALCMTLTGLVSGHLQLSIGYINYFIFVMVATIPSFLICWYAPFHQKDNA